MVMYILDTFHHSPSLSLCPLYQEKEREIGQLVGEKQTIQEKMTKVTFDNSAMREQLKEATEMVMSRHSSVSSAIKCSNLESYTYNIVY